MTLDRLVIWRHGQTAWNAGHRMQGHRDVPLDDVGRAQAGAAAPSVAALQPEVIVSSDLSRAATTAETLAGVTGCELRLDERLRENDLGEWEGKHWAEIVEHYPTQWARWLAIEPDYAPPGGSSRRSTAERARSVVDELDDEGFHTAALVTHGGTSLALTALLLQLPGSVWRSLSGIGNCHWNVLRRSDFGWRVQGYNVGLTGLALPGAVGNLDTGIGS